MGKFSADWLALREPADRAARSLLVTRALADVLPDGRVVTVLDLATGTGANARFLIDQFPARQRWVLVDHDAALLDEMSERMSSWGAAHGYRAVDDPDGVRLRRGERACHLVTRRVDLNALEDRTLFDGCQVVTASALLDLAGERWLRGLASRCHRSGVAVLFALTYDGRLTCSPPEPEDDTIRRLVNRHQRTDKGLGEAAGPLAAGLVAGFLAELGYRVQRERADWLLSSESQALQRQLIEGWAEAATEIAPEQSALVHRWLARRLGHVAAGRSWLTVGHEDLAAWLPGERG